MKGKEERRRTKTASPYISVSLYHLAHAALQRVKLQGACRRGDGRLRHNGTQPHLQPSAV